MTWMMRAGRGINVLLARVVKVCVLVARRSDL
jgi:hypothetical protein